MSKVEVNTIEPQCGTTLTVGAVGTNVAVPSNVVKSNALQASDAGNIIKQCGTTITLGATGDTIALASGASQTGFGRTGTVDWITTPKVTGDSPITGVTGKGYFLNTTGGIITVNLPAGVAGSIVSMADYAATWQTNKVTVSANGSEKIGGETNDATLNTEGQSVTFVYVDSTQGWINTMDSTSNVRGVPPYMSATVSGACNTLTTAPDCANVKIAKFLGPGTFCVSAVSSEATRNTVGYMAIAGGGGGGHGNGGGGGAGGYREGRNVPIDNFTASPLVADFPGPNCNAVTVTATAYPIIIGGGGAGAPSGSAGTVSTFSTITSAGGGCQGGHGTCGGSGGSGGGGGNGGTGGIGNTPPVTPPQGQTGGNGAAGPSYAGGGGGGAGGIGGSTSSSSAGGAGGNGVSNDITGASVIRGGGGGGVRDPGGAGGNGGTGGGGDSGRSPGNPGTGCGAAGGINLGGGGGGGTSHCSGSGGGLGGSGVVYIRYKFQ